MKTEASAGYVVLEVAELGDVECKCLRCEWRGWSRNLRGIKACQLTPGDVSPLGRCPKCFDLAYADRPADRIVGFADQTFAAMCELLALHEALHEGHGAKVEQIELAIRRARKLQKAVKGRRLPRRRTSDSNSDGSEVPAETESDRQDNEREAVSSNRAELATLGMQNG